jgi:2'-5' RNA ligase
MRLFVGIPLADQVRDEIAAMVAQLRRPADDLRWTAPEAWHITLQFLGNAGAEQLECLKAQLNDVRSAPVAVQLGAVGAFERAGVVFVDVDPGPELVGLHQQVTAATAKCGFVPEERPFHPHITLARARGRRRFRAVPALRPWRENPPRFTPFPGREVLLYESFTGEGGSRYEVRARFGLGT